MNSVFFVACHIKYVKLFIKGFLISKKLIYQVQDYKKAYLWGTLSNGVALRVEIVKGLFAVKVKP